jgi:hypothetical protein
MEIASLCAGAHSSAPQGGEMIRKWLIGGLSALSIVGLSAGAHAGPIISATSAVINSSGPGFGTLTETFNQAGLLSGYTSGVTDFDTYLATNPQHTMIFSGFEWFSNSGTSSASVTYNLGFAQTIDAIALWNEESSGIGLLDLLTSLDGVSFVSLLSGLLPTDNPLTDPLSTYGADVISFAALSAQYVRFDMSRCPQPVPGSFSSCAIGEVAFRSGQITQVPEPATLGIFLIGLAGLMYLWRRNAGLMKAA